MVQGRGTQPGPTHKQYIILGFQEQLESMSPSSLPRKGFLSHCKSPQLLSVSPTVTSSLVLSETLQSA